MAEPTKGIVKNINSGKAKLHVPGRASTEVLVPAQLVRQFGLVEGATVTGTVQPGKGRLRLTSVESICGLAPGEFRERPDFGQLVAISPMERFPLAITGKPSTRIIDMVAPIGKGTRGLIVSPPKAGKTMILEEIGQAIRAAEPETRIVILLIDERPEEVTHFRRSMDAEVFASSSDQKLRKHVELADLMLAHIRTELECGHDVVVLLDSLTRLARTFNLSGRGRGRTMSGGLDAAALEVPRRFFGVARNIEHGGSVTLIATVLVDTGSRMDQMIYEEFKGTGNSEIVLDRSLADARIFPAINMLSSSTRRDEFLYDADSYARLNKFRRALAQHKPQQAMELVLQLLEKYPTNDDLLQSIRG